jgi:hypothetical protein
MCNYHSFWCNYFESGAIHVRFGAFILKVVQFIAILVQLHFNVLLLPIKMGSLNPILSGIRTNPTFLSGKSMTLYYLFRSSIALAWASSPSSRANAAIFAPFSTKAFSLYMMILDFF